MKTYLSWRRGALSTTYRIFSNERQIGRLKNPGFKQTSEGRINKKKYRFTTRGVFKQETQIMDGDSNKVIGKITYNAMMTKATIKLGDRTITWKYNNGWQTRWSLYNEEGILMKFSGRSTKGTIACEEIDELLVLIGLFVTNYYQQAMIAILVAVFIPIWVTLFT